MRSRYWKLSPEEMEGLSYQPDKLLNWEIKGVKEPEEDAKFIGVFLYRNGTPFDYEPVKGIVYFYNNIEKNEISQVTKFLKSKFGGEDISKGERIFLKNSKEIYQPQEISKLARELREEFKVKPIISLEFSDYSSEEQKKAGLPEAKLLPIPGV